MNALRHGGTVGRSRFSGEMRPAGGLTIVCEDNGVGVPVNEKERIFERGHGRNTGLGLYLSKEILATTGMTIAETGGRGSERGSRSGFRPACTAPAPPPAAKDSCSTATEAYSHRSPVVIAFRVQEARSSRRHAPIRWFRPMALYETARYGQTVAVTEMVRVLVTGHDGGGRYVPGTGYPEEVGPRK